MRIQLNVVSSPRLHNFQYAVEHRKLLVFSKKKKFI